MRSRTVGILESSLYVDDVDAWARFYGRIFGFRVNGDFEGPGCPTMQARNRQVLLLCKKGASPAIPIAA